MSLTAGEKLGPYEIVALIGAGGMGEVYRARDPRLGRDVAIKISAQQFSERFDREARAVAALNHPNICTLYDVGPNYLVMELVEGDSPKGPLPLDDALRIAWQIADALEAAHEKGITHRDLKPGNIKVKPDGAVKVLDFGLAKMSATGSGDPADSPTLSLAATQTGVILGTAGYMAPEQARGKTVDRRADIWAFGVILYELLTGERMFAGETISDTLAQVLMKEPDLSKAPPKVQKLLGRCLQKDPKLRLRDIGEARFLLETESGIEAPPQVQSPSSLLRIAPWAVAILAIAAASFFAYRHYTQEIRMVKLFLPPPEGGTFTVENNPPLISPDGQRIVFAATVGGTTSLWVRELAALEARRLPGTEEARFPFWAPDSRRIAFFSNGRLKRIDMTGGPAVAIAEARLGMGGTWNKNDVILFSPDGIGGLYRVSAGGGPVSPLTELDKSKAESSHRYPWFLPDSRHFLYLSRNASETATVYFGDLESKEIHRVLSSISNIAYSPPGHLLFVNGGTLMAQPFDARSGATTGDAQPIVEHVDAPATVFGQTGFSVSQNGILVYSSGAVGGATQLTWFDRAGNKLGVLGSPGVITWPVISPDGTKIAYDVRVGEQTAESDVWLYDLEHGTNPRFTLEPGFESFPVWSGDGRDIAYTANRAGYAELRKKAVAGVTPEELLQKSDSARQSATDWSRDGQYIVLSRSNTREIWILPMIGDRKPFLYLQSQGASAGAKISPDGRWLAYQSDEGGKFEIVVETFPKRGGQWQVSTSGGTRPVWSRNGRELYFISLDQQLMASEIVPGSSFEHRVPKPLFEVHMDGNVRYDVSKDGKFLMLPRTEHAAVAPITVVLNWQTQLKK
jgi:eukaryotic-like serine/threonine-protein kinase